MADDGVVSTLGWRVVAGLVLGLLLTWCVLVFVLWRTQRRLGHTERLRVALSLLPDVVRLLRALAADGSLPRGVRVRLILLLVYLASPIDLVPDFIPVLGYADDAVLVVLVLRSVTRRAGPEAVARHWAGSPEGLASVLRLAGLPSG
jgi:uncharacterized membrane protein YkvA (DUF1232 family)